MRSSREAGKENTRELRKKNQRVGREIQQSHRKTSTSGGTGDQRRGGQHNNARQGSSFVPCPRCGAKMCEPFTRFRESAGVCVRLIWRMEQGRGRIAQKVHWNDRGKDMGGRRFLVRGGFLECLYSHGKSGNWK